MPDPSLSEQLRHWTRRLADHSDSARIDAEALVKHISGLDDAGLILRAHDALDADQLAAINALVERRRRGEPVAYLTGEREFYSLPLQVEAGVLIPRPETELLVEHALRFTHQHPGLHILDLGTGSGAIALAIARHAPSARIIATDTNKKSLVIAQANADRHRIRNVRFLLGDWYQALPEGQLFDLIVSNPPYISSNDPHLNQGDLRFEPRRALASGTSGLRDIRRIIGQAQSYLRPNGMLALEHGYDQAVAVQALLQAHGFRDLQSLEDLSGLPRVSSARLV